MVAISNFFLNVFQPIDVFLFSDKVCPGFDDSQGVLQEKQTQDYAMLKLCCIRPYLCCFFVNSPQKSGHFH